MVLARTLWKNKSLESCHTNWAVICNISLLFQKINHPSNECFQNGAVFTFSSVDNMVGHTCNILLVFFKFWQMIAPLTRLQNRKDFSHFLFFISPIKVYHHSNHCWIACYNLLYLVNFWTKEKETILPNIAIETDVQLFMTLNVQLQLQNLTKNFAIWIYCSWPYDCVVGKTQ